MKIALLIVTTALFTSACASALVGGATTGTYHAEKEPRNISATFSDAGITAGINTRLIKAKDINSTRINVKTLQGMVYLHGYVTSRKTEYRVIRIARSQPGVKKVISKLILSAP